jgi:hypothetical protein
MLGARQPGERMFIFSRQSETGAWGVPKRDFAGWLLKL